MKHLDLFSGIGGFSLAFDNVFHEQKNQHQFVEIDPFCQEVLKKHWPESQIIDDIRHLTPDTEGDRARGEPRSVRGAKRRQDNGFISEPLNKDSFFILTGGFPCQPFSQAGRRKGTEDDRYLWPAMLSAISFFRPRWVVAENVAGLASWNNGVVFETVCADLEAQGYEVQPFIIPAVAVGAPHRRDRIWFIAHTESTGAGSENGTFTNKGGRTSKDRREGLRQTHGQIGTNRLEPANTDASNTRQEHGGEGRNEGMETESSKRSSRPADAERQNKNATHSEREGHKGEVNKKGQGARYRRGAQQQEWDKDWAEVASRLCRVDDGIPKRLDRNSRLKALGNAIVPQVAEEIFKAVKEADSAFLSDLLSTTP
jgi:DNA (cytosine-5)-methyltransferase 1